MTTLRQRMLEDLQIRHYSKTTIRLYLHAVSAFAQHFGKPPDQLGAEHIRLYQLFLAQEKQVSLSTFIQVVSALRFFYTHTLNQKVAIDRIPFPRRERKLPLILNREEVKALLQAPCNLRRLSTDGRKASLSSAASSSDRSARTTVCNVVWYVKACASRAEVLSARASCGGLPGHGTGLSAREVAVHSPNVPD